VLQQCWSSFWGGWEFCRGTYRRHSLPHPQYILLHASTHTRTHTRTHTHTPPRAFLSRIDAIYVLVLSHREPNVACCKLLAAGFACLCLPFDVLFGTIYTSMALYTRDYSALGSACESKAVDRGGDSASLLIARKKIIDFQGVVVLELNVGMDLSYSGYLLLLSCILPVLPVVVGLGSSFWVLEHSCDKSRWNFVSTKI
jgi:hypothetical protein